MSVYTRTEAAEVGACQGINQPFVRLCRHPRSPPAPARQNVGRNSKANERLFVRKYAIALPKLARSVRRGRWTLAIRAMIYIRRANVPHLRLRS